MTTLYHRRLEMLRRPVNQQLLSGIRHGIEREGLRVTPDARLSQAPHPDALGKTLTHPYITTDYSEALLEFITPVHNNIADALHFLDELHRFTGSHLDSELLWAGSMPPKLEGEPGIPIARYGASNPGVMKHIYREGLAHRYGKAMQTIAGIHYNFSLPEELWTSLHEASGQDQAMAMQDFQSESYMSLIRNFRRYSWLLMYLFGASPAVSKSFFTHSGHSAELSQLDDDTLFMPWATSLRMSDLGYTNNAQSSLNICYNTLDEYISSLAEAIRTPYEPYEKIGLKNGDHYLQLNTNLLQIENEYYSNIRPKRIARRGEKPLTALRKQGIEYIEVRCLDINPFEPLGMNTVDAHFLDVFLIYCALMDSPTIEAEECARVTENFGKTVNEGRRPGLTLMSEEGAVSLSDWGQKLLDEMLPVAKLLDGASDTEQFTQSIAVQREKLSNSDQTPSAKLLHALESGNVSYIELLRELSREHTEAFRRHTLSEERQAYFSQLSRESREDQQRLEDLDDITFDEFLKRYHESE
ncbi:MAG: glutamate--cysteine ligase [Endozoicomonas sp.]